MFVDQYLPSIVLDFKVQFIGYPLYSVSTIICLNTELVFLAITRITLGLSHSVITSFIKFILTIFT